MEKKSTATSQRKFERVPRVTRSKAAAVAAIRSTAAAVKVAAPAPAGTAKTGQRESPATNTRATRSHPATSTSTAKADKQPAGQTAPEGKEAKAEDSDNQQPSGTSANNGSPSSASSGEQEQQQQPKAVVTTVAAAASVVVPSLSSSVQTVAPASTTSSSGIHVTTTDLVHASGAHSAAGSESGTGGVAQPVKVEAVIDLAMSAPIPGPITAALEELLASHHHLNELEKVGVVDSHPGGLLLRPGTGTSTPSLQEKVATTTGAMGLTLLAQAAAQEEKTGDPEPLPPISQLTSSGFTLNDNQVIYQQTAPMCLPEAGGVSYAHGTGVATWTDTPADLTHYNWFSNMVAGINPAQSVAQVQLSHDHLQLPGMDTLTHPHMLLFDTLSAATVPGQAMDMQAQLNSMAAMQRQAVAATGSADIMVHQMGGSPGAGVQSMAGPTLAAPKVESLATSLSNEEQSSTSATALGALPSISPNVYQQPKCAYCDHRFQTRTIRDQHARECLSNPYKCPTCQKACLGTVKLQRHIRSHLRSRTSTEAEDTERRLNNGPDPKCAYCSVRFPSRVVRDRHSRMCERNPYRCKLCSKAFLGTAKLTRHLRVHAAEEEAKRTRIAGGSVPGQDGTVGLAAKLEHAAGSHDSASTSTAVSGSSSECNDIGIDENTERPQATDRCPQPSLIQMAMPSATGRLPSSLGQLPSIGGTVSSINVMSEGLSLPGADAGGLAMHQAGPDPATTSLASATYSNGQCVQAPLPQSVPNMIVAMPLLSCW